MRNNMLNRLSIRSAMVIGATLSGVVAASEGFANENERVTLEETTSEISTTDASTQTISSGQIRKAQEKLNDLGYNAGPVDGIVGKQTLTALRKFQIDHNRPVSGKLDTSTLAALEMDYEDLRREQAGRRPFSQSVIESDKDDDHRDEGFERDRY